MSRGDDLRAEIPQGAGASLRFAWRRWGLWGSLSRYLLLRAERASFLRAPLPGLDRPARRRLLRAFDQIQARVPCAHSPYQFLLIARYLLPLSVPGPIVELGCYLGGSSAKLSWLARLTGRRLVICDSFAGLPAPGAAEATLTGFAGAPGATFYAGKYRATQAQVEANIAAYGCPEVCDFVPGYFADTLPRLDAAPAVVYLDVDLVSSARTCIQYLWPRTRPGGLWFTHEASFPAYIQGILDPDWWTQTLTAPPPLIWGAGSGLAELAPSLALLMKPDGEQMDG